MRLLLDTHIWLWTIQDRRRLGRRAARYIENPANELWLSPISAWEAFTLHAKGRIRVQGSLAEWLDRATRGTQEAPFTHEIALTAGQMTLHPDPADRILVATASLLDLTLVTADERLLGLGFIRTLANN